MTRFARPSKKTSLEATPWHELVNSGGNDLLSFCVYQTKYNLSLQIWPRNGLPVVDFVAKLPDTLQCGKATV